MSGTLEIRQESGGPRHYLEGRPVHAGDHLELALDGGGWCPGRYEWTYNPERLPMLFLALDGQLVAELEIPAGAVLRWPK